MRATITFLTLALVLENAAARGIDINITRAADWQYIGAADRFNTSQQTFGFEPNSPNPATLMNGPFTQDCLIEPTATYYLWAHVSGLPDNGAGSVQIYGLGLQNAYATSPATVGGVLYRHKKGTLYQRWDDPYQSAAEVALTA